MINLAYLMIYGMTILLSIISIIFSLGNLIYNIIEYKKVKKEYEEEVLKKRSK